MNNIEKQERFDSFMKEHVGIIQKLCRGYSNTKEDFEDNMQEVSLQLWKSIDRFEGKSKSSTWVYRLTLNVCLYNLSKRKKRIDRAVDESVIKKTSDQQESLTVSDERIDMLYDSIATLNPIDRAIIMLYLEKKKHAEIGEIVGLNLVNVGVKVNRIKKKLKTIVDERLARNLG